DEVIHVVDDCSVRTEQLEEVATEEALPCTTLLGHQNDGDLALCLRLLNHSCHPADQVVVVILVTLADVLSHVLEIAQVSRPFRRLDLETAERVEHAGSITARVEHDSLVLTTSRLAEPPLSVLHRHLLSLLVLPEDVTGSSSGEELARVLEGERAVIGLAHHYASTT